MDKSIIETRPHTAVVVGSNPTLPIQIW